MEDEVISHIIRHVESDTLFGSKKHPAYEVLVDEERQ
jgi:hypothetical protein